MLGNLANALGGVVGRVAPDSGGRRLVGSALAWGVGRVLSARSVSWPRVVVAGIGATVLSDLVGRALEPADEARDRAYEEDPDALLVRLASGVGTAAGYASLLYPRLPGSPLVKGLIFGALEVAAAPRGGLARLATETVRLDFPLKGLAAPTDGRAGPVANLAFGIGLGLLYRPDPDA